MPLPALAPATIARAARRVLPAAATAANPLDYTSLLWDDPARCAALVAALAGDPASGALLVLYDDADGDRRRAPQRLGGGAGRGPRAAQRAPMPVAVASTLPELATRRRRDRPGLRSAGCAVRAAALARRAGR